MLLLWLRLVLFEIKAWMVENRLMINVDQTNLPTSWNTSTEHQLRHRPVDYVTIGGHRIAHSSTAMNVGVISDRALSMDAHTKEVCRFSMFHHSNIKKIRKCLPMEVAEQLIHVFVSSKL